MKKKEKRPVGRPQGGRTLARRVGKKGYRLVAGGLPAKMLQIEREGYAYRRTLEEQVEAIYGEVSITHAHLIDTATAATVQAGICRWLIRHKLDTMSPTELRGCTDDIGKAKNRRDKAIKELKLDAPPKDPWEIDGTATEIDE